MSIHTACSHVAFLLRSLGWSWNQKTLYKSCILVQSAVEKWQLQFSAKAFNEDFSWFGTQTRLLCNKALGLLNENLDSWYSKFKMWDGRQKSESNISENSFTWRMILVNLFTFSQTGFESNLVSHLFSYVPIYPNLMCIAELRCVALSLYSRMMLKMNMKEIWQL